MRKRRKRRLRDNGLQRVRRCQLRYYDQSQLDANSRDTNSSGEANFNMIQPSRLRTKQCDKVANLIKFLLIIGSITVVRQYNNNYYYFNVLCDNLLIDQTQISSQNYVSVSAGIPNVIVGSRWQSQIFLPCKFDHLDEDQTVSIILVQISVPNLT